MESGQTESRRPAAVGLRVVLRDQRDAQVFERRVDLPAAQFLGGKAPDVGIELPIGRLPEGEYLLSVEGASGNHSADAAIRIAIRR